MCYCTNWLNNSCHCLLHYERFRIILTRTHRSWSFHTSPQNYDNKARWEKYFFESESIHFVSEKSGFFTGWSTNNVVVLVGELYKPKCVVMTAFNRAVKCLWNNALRHTTYYTAHTKLQLFSDFRLVSQRLLLPGTHMDSIWIEFDVTQILILRPPEIEAPGPP